MVALHSVRTNAAQQQATQMQLEAADANFQQDAWMPMEQVTSVYLRKPYVIGMADNELGLIPPGDWANIYILQH